MKYVMPINNDVKKATRDGFGEGLLYLGKTNPHVWALCADLTDSDRMVKFRDEFPERFVECGIQEQNMMGVAAGLAVTGKVAFAGSFAVFAPGRNWDQLRVSVCYSKHNVKLYGGHAGITVGEDGATHQALEDIAITRVLPNMTVIVPCDSNEMARATIAAAHTPGPFYLRGGRAKFPQVTTVDAPFEIGKALPLRNGKHATIIACGIMVREALIAAEELKKSRIDVAVLNMHTIKPLDEHAVIHAAHETGAIVTAEEHQVTGGLGSAVAEAVAKHMPVPIEMVGVKDTFGESGTADALLDKYGLRAKDIVAAVKHVLVRKKKEKPKEFKPSSSVVKKATTKPRKTKRKASKKVVKKKTAKKKATTKNSRTAKKARKPVKKKTKSKKKARKP